MGATSQWNKSLETGVEEIDMQHQKLLETVNKYIEDVNEGKKDDAVNSTLKFLETYVVEHFSAEEKLQLISEFPGFVKHKALHDEFIKEFRELKMNIPDKEKALELSRMVNLWLVEHIGLADKTFTDFYKEKER